jgi:biotin synthase
MISIPEILAKPVLSKADIVSLISLRDADAKVLRDRALQVKAEQVGRKVWFRGLIEYSNICSKDCYYCGIRCSNKKYARYTMSDDEVLEAVLYAYRNRFASIVIQSGEQTGARFTDAIEHLLREISRITNNELHVTLSLGEQSEETYRRWFDAGAQRYLLRIEVSNPSLYAKLHPGNKHHSYGDRLNKLHLLRKTGYMVGTGVMIGLPFQGIEDLADDLIFMRDFDVDMVGMGPYIEHEDTPLYALRDQLLPLQDRFELSLNMVAVLRIMMKDINIAATTAMQTIDPQGREKALLAGANVMMPNLTPLKYKQEYLLYKDKPGISDDAERTREIMEQNIRAAGDEIGYGEWGDPRHFQVRSTKYEGRRTKDEGRNER